MNRTRIEGTNASVGKVAGKLRGAGAYSYENLTPQAHLESVSAMYHPAAAVLPFFKFARRRFCASAIKTMILSRF